MYILGINAYHPDSSAAIINDGQLIAAAEEERFLRIKHWAGFPRQAVEYCLSEAGIPLREVDFIALNRDPFANLYKKISFSVHNRPSFGLIKNRIENICKIQGVRDTFCKEFAISKNELRARFYNIEHHRAHLASAFFVSPFDSSTIVSIDGFGDFASCLVARGHHNKINELYAINFPHSLGIFYTAITQYLGFMKFGDEYKMMGLAAYGKPKYLSELGEILLLKPKGKFELNLDYFSFHKNNAAMEWNGCEPKLGRVFSDKLIERFGALRKQEEELANDHCDLAASAQAIYELALMHILNFAFGLTKDTNLCLAGGCALNSLANGKIFHSTPFKEIYIQPAASDAGGSMGAAYYLNHQLLDNKRAFILNEAYWGPHYSGQVILAEVERIMPRLNQAGCSIQEIKEEEALCSRVAAYIADGLIVGWFQGRMEWGPRALGNRSILVDPRRPKMKDILNARIKRREWFRPFAPSILLEKVGDYFEIDYPDPFMLKVYPVKAEKRSLIPAVTHIDGTGRLQTVSRIENPLYWRLIREFEKITGIPVLLNTSFNENEPIVNTPKEALECFLRTKMDLLVMENLIIKKPVIP